MKAPRYCDRPFPPYAFVPGEKPHPTRDPAGHSYEPAQAKHPEPLEPVDPEDWRDAPDYLFGVDLYNAGYLWEAHEAWEGLWKVADDEFLQADFLQGLIQCAAGCLKIPMGQRVGMHHLIELGTRRLAFVSREEGRCYMGLEVPPFVARLRAFAAAEPESIEGRPLLVLE